MDFKDLKDETRLLIEADLEPLQGHSFQPTGFPDLGAATFRLPGPNKTQMLVLESYQSVANRLENTIWDEVNQQVIQPLQGIPYIEVHEDGALLTNSLLEAHRLNSSYILGTKGQRTEFFDVLAGELNALAEGPVNFQKLAKTLVKYDINCLLHGVFLADKELAGGRYKLARALSGFIEAYNVEPIEMGGVKNDRVDPTGKAKGADGAREGRGNIPYHRTFHTAERITAYFSLDLTQIRGYRLGAPIEDLLIGMSIWKIQRFLRLGLRLRSNCDLKLKGEPRITMPESYKLPDLQKLTKALPALVEAAAPAFTAPAVTTVEFKAEASKPA